MLPSTWALPTLSSPSTSVFPSQKSVFNYTFKFLYIISKNCFSIPILTFSARFDRLISKSHLIFEPLSTQKATFQMSR